MSDCRVQQILVPENDAIVGFGGAGTLEEQGFVNLAIGQVAVTVTFKTPKLNSGYEFLDLYVSGIGEAQPAAIVAVPDVQTANGFTVQLSGAPDTVNYNLVWHVRVVDETENPPVAGPVAQFTFSPSGFVISGSTIYFTDTSTDILPAVITNWAWDFGDGNTSALQNPTHIYNAAGTYSVKLTVTDSFLATGTVTNQITILPVPPLTISARVYRINDLPVPSAAYLAINFNGERWDTDTMFDFLAHPDRLTCHTAGYFKITANLAITSNVNGVRNLAFLLNGLDYIAACALPGLSIGIEHPIYIALDTDYKLAVNDYVQCMIFQDSGAQLSVLSLPKYSPEFSMTRL